HLFFARWLGVAQRGLRVVERRVAVVHGLQRFACEDHYVDAWRVLLMATSGVKSLLIGIKGRLLCCVKDRIGEPSNFGSRDLNAVRPNKFMAIRRLGDDDVTHARAISQGHLRYFQIPKMHCRRPAQDWLDKSSIP